MNRIFKLAAILATLTFLPVLPITVAPVVAQPSERFTSPEDLPFVELKPATQRQKEILSRMPESEYSRIPLEFIRVAENDLNGDGTTEFIATYKSPRPGYCGNAGCPTAIYSNQGGRWRLINEVLGGSAIRVGNTRTNGFRDLLRPTGSDSGIHRVLTFTNNEYSFTHFQDGNNRFRAIPRREVPVSESTVFYSRPSISSPVKLPYSIGVEPVVVEAKTNDWYLVRPCTSRVCGGTFVYLPVEVVDGRRRTSSNQPQNTSFRTCKLPIFNTGYATNGYTVSFPSSYSLSAIADLVGCVNAM